MQAESVWVRAGSFHRRKEYDRIRLKVGIVQGWSQKIFTHTESMGMVPKSSRRRQKYDPQSQNSFLLSGKDLSLHWAIEKNYPYFLKLCEQNLKSGLYFPSLRALWLILVLRHSSVQFEERIDLSLHPEDDVLRDLLPHP